MTTPHIFFNATPTTEIYTLSLHDALPIYAAGVEHRARDHPDDPFGREDQSVRAEAIIDRKSTRLNSSHVAISYAVFCLKKKNNRNAQHNTGIQTLCPAAHLV